MRPFCFALIVLFVLNTPNRACSRRTTAANVIRIVLTGISPLRRSDGAAPSACDGSRLIMPFQRSSDRLGRSIIVTVICHRVPERAALRSNTKTGTPFLLRRACPVLSLARLITKAITAMYLLKVYSIFKDRRRATANLNRGLAFLSLHISRQKRGFDQSFAQKSFHFFLNEVNTAPNGILIYVFTVGNFSRRKTFNFSKQISSFLSFCQTRAK